MDMRVRKPVSDPMTEIAAFVTDLKVEFGEQEIDEAIRSALHRRINVCPVDRAVRNGHY